MPQPPPWRDRVCLLKVVGTSSPRVDRRNHERSHTDAGAGGTGADADAGARGAGARAESGEPAGVTLRTSRRAGPSPRRHSRRRRSAGSDLSILPDADADQPSCSTQPQTLTLPRPLHHPRERSQARHVTKAIPSRRPAGRSPRRASGSRRTEGGPKPSPERTTGGVPLRLACLARPLPRFVLVGSADDFDFRLPSRPVGGRSKRRSGSGARR
jgi:hypothetical protein